MNKELTSPNALLPGDYIEFLRDLKTRIHSTQLKAAAAVNRELIALYWEIGKGIAERQENAGWGDVVVEQLARDLRHEFPEVKGFSRSNVFLMRQVFLAYREYGTKVQQAVGQIPWGHNIMLLSKVKEPEKRLWYLEQTVAHGWSRAVLDHQIQTDLYARQLPAAKTHNFAQTLPPLQSDLAHQMLKDSYVFDFLSLGQAAHERDLERALVERIREFLLELGAGFAFMGSQYHLEVGGRDFYIDLLFYHHRLRCLVAIDLKMQDFEPEFAGKMNFYLSALDDLVRHPHDAPSVGIVLCRGKERTIAEYSLRDMSKPMGVADYRLTTHLPDELQNALPSPADFERILQDMPQEKF